MDKMCLIRYNMDKNFLSQVQTMVIMAHHLRKEVKSAKKHNHLAYLAADYHDHVQCIFQPNWLKVKK